ncbi:M28 family peptidase [Synoicihabitans lomoniglobus]|uniref:Carboxypeptidase Q n=1 Tax=Synoicihabitans lomoniglobus TaxID=2909285 RepID=A0AAF0CRW7_9BACT|nr:M28 family peptidase [Opitutaceae bacterium LMO-M01]WED66969.1 M28 family peptidase [Opitutaceae bacterium LMO-M01]
MKRFLKHSDRRGLIVALVMAALSTPAMALTPAGAAQKVLADEAPVTFLEHLCDDHGGRLTGSAANEAALHDLEQALHDLGLTPERETFSMPGWVREEDTLRMILPVKRKMRAIGLGYIETSAAMEGAVVDLGRGGAEAFTDDMPTGAIGLFGPSASGRANDVADRAKAHGFAGLMFINREGGGQLLARTGGFHGEPLSLPIFSVTQEEGFWMRRLIARGLPVKVGLRSRSYTQPITTTNLRLRFPGKSAETIVVGAHFDSWDRGQGAMDNGLGIAQLFALARTLRGQELERSVELVWFNGEEQGLWGSRYAATEGADAERPPIVMVNLDMVGVPIAVNALGDADLMPALERWNTGRGDAALSGGVENKTWIASDHTPYQLAGVRTVTFNAPIPRESVRFYHDFGDTFDKLSSEIIRESSAVIASLVVSLADDPELPGGTRDAAATEEMFRNAKLEKRLQAVGMWPAEFGPVEP